MSIPLRHTLRHLSVTARLITANIAVWLAVCVAGLWCNPEPWLSLPADPVAWITRPWTLLTYMVVQYDFWHLLMNVLWLLMFGRVLELTMPGSAVRKLYIAGGLAGGVAYVALGAVTGGSGALCGASASVLAVMAAAGLRSPDMELNLLLLGRVRLKWVVVAGIILLMVGAGGGSIAAHVAGLLAGVVYIIMLGRPRRPASKRVSRRGSRRVRKAIQRHHDDTRRLDALLAKISTSSYDSLSPSEKRELHHLSARLRTQSSNPAPPADK